MTFNLVKKAFGKFVCTVIGYLLVPVAIVWGLLEISKENKEILAYKIENDYPFPADELFEFVNPLTWIYFYRLDPEDYKWVGEEVSERVLNNEIDLEEKIVKKAMEECDNS